VGRPAICGDRIVVLYCMNHRTSRNTAPNMFIQVIDWRKGHVKGVSPLYSLESPTT
jgi:hypothetical protein